jgi:hypothetical protein
VHREGEKEREGKGEVDRQREGELRGRGSLKNSLTQLRFGDSKI